MDSSEQGKSPEYGYLDATSVSLVFNANNSCYKLFQNINYNEVDLAQIFVA